VKPAAASTEDGSDASVNDSAVAEPSATGDTAAKVAVGATFVTVTGALYVLDPPSLSAIRPYTMYAPLSLNEQLAVAVYVEPSQE
jgi:hypothetical protein